MAFFARLVIGHTLSFNFTPLEQAKFVFVGQVLSHLSGTCQFVREVPLPSRGLIPTLNVFQVAIVRSVSRAFDDNCQVVLNKGLFQVMADVKSTKDAQEVDEKYRPVLQLFTSR